MARPESASSEAEPREAASAARETPHEAVAEPAAAEPAAREEAAAVLEPAPLRPAAPTEAPAAEQLDGAARPGVAPRAAAQAAKPSLAKRLLTRLDDSLVGVEKDLIALGDTVSGVGAWINAPSHLPYIGKLWSWGPGMLGHLLESVGHTLGGHTPDMFLPGGEQTDAAKRLESKARTLASMEDFPGGAGGLLSSRKQLRALLTKDIAESDLPYASAIRSRPNLKPDLPETLEQVRRAPMARVTDIGLASEEHSGSAGLVRLGYLADGRPVALKTYYPAEMPGESRAAELPGLMLQEARAAQLYSELGIGPQFHGIWKDADGRWNVVFDIARGDFRGTPVKDVTFSDLETILARMKAAGIGDAGDLQMYRSSEGRLMVIDPNRVAERLGQAPREPFDSMYGDGTGARIDVLREAPQDLGRRYLERLEAVNPDAFDGLTRRLLDNPKSAEWARQRYGDIIERRAAGRFVPAQALKEVGPMVLSEAKKRVDEIDALRARKGLRPMTSDERDEALQTRLYRVLNPILGQPGRKTGRGGLVVLDTPMADPSFKTYDHHGRNFDPDHPEVNSTMLMLQEIERYVSKNGTSMRAVNALARRYERVHTDNFGDGLWAAWVARNIHRVARDPQLRELILRATHYEDFGLFGNEAVAQAKSDPKLAEAVELQNAILNGYDKLVARLGLDSDRFGGLPREDQPKVFEAALRHIDKVLSEADYRRANASEFEEGVKIAVDKARAAAIELPADQRAALVQELGSEAAVDAAAARLLGDARVVDYDQMQGVGLFAGWAGQARSHDKKLLLSFKTLPADADGHARTQMILSVPHGQSYRALEPAGEWLQKANERKAAQLHEPNPGSVFGRSALQVAFSPGLVLTRAEIMSELVRYSHAEAASAARAEPAPAAAPQPQPAAAPAPAPAAAPRPQPLMAPVPAPRGLLRRLASSAARRLSGRSSEAAPDPDRLHSLYDLLNSPPSLLRSIKLIGAKREIAQLRRRQEAFQRDFTELNARLDQADGEFARRRDALGGDKALIKALEQESAQRKAALINDLIAQRGGVEKLYPNELATLYRTFQKKGLFKEMVELYDSSRSPAFRDSEPIKQLLGVALNKIDPRNENGLLDRAERELRSIPGEPSGETAAILGKIYKQRYQKLRGEQKQSDAVAALQRSVDILERGFANGLEYYPGINLVYNKITLAMERNDPAGLRAAERLANLVFASVEKSGGLHSADFWAVATMVESAIIAREGAPLTAEPGSFIRSRAEWDAVIKTALPRMIELGKVDWEIGSTVANLRTFRGQMKDLGESDVAQLDAVIEALEHRQQHIHEPPPKAPLPPRDEEGLARAQAVLSAGFAFFDAKSNTVHGNVQFNGQTHATTVNTWDVAVVRALISHLGLDKPGADLVQLNRAVDTLIRTRFGTADLEDLLGERHAEFERFMEGMLSLAAIERGSGTADTRTNLMLDFWLGEGDCRPHAFVKQLFFDVWKVDQTNALMTEAVAALGRGDTAAYDAAMRNADQLKRTEMRVYDSVLWAPVRTVEKYKPILTADGKFRVDQDWKADPAKRNPVEDHTWTALIILDERGRLVEFRQVDAFYQNVYEFGGETVVDGKVIAGKPIALAHVADNGAVSTTMPAVDEVTGRVETLPLEIRPTAYSGDRSRRSGGIDQEIDDIGGVRLRGMLMAAMKPDASVFYDKGLKAAIDQLDVRVGDHVTGPLVEVRDLTAADQVADARLAGVDVRTAWAGYATPPDAQYTPLMARFAKAYAEAVGPERLGQVASPATGDGIDQAVALSALEPGSARAPKLLLLTDKADLQYADSMRLPGEAAEAYAGVPKLVLDLRDRGERASADAANTLIVAGGRGVTVAHFVNHALKGSRIVLLDLGAPKERAWDAKEGRPEDAGRYLIDQLDAYREWAQQVRDGHADAKLVLPHPEIEGLTADFLREHGERLASDVKVVRLENAEDAERAAQEAAAHLAPPRPSALTRLGAAARRAWDAAKPFSDEDLDPIRDWAARTSYRVSRLLYGTSDLLVDRVPQTPADFVKVFGTQRAIDANVNADIVAAIGRRLGVEDTEKVKTHLRNLVAQYRVLEQARAGNRAVLKTFEAMNPGKDAGQLLNDLARETHESWLKTVKGSPKYVEYTQTLHDLLYEYAEQGAIKGVKDGAQLEAPDGKDGKRKIKAADLLLQGDALDRFKRRFEAATGRSFEGAEINTIAGSWDALSAIRPHTAIKDWTTRRAAFLYGLQAESVGAIVSAFSGPKGRVLLERLSKGSDQEKLEVLTEVLRKINVGWRLNNPWNGFGDRLLHDPFDLEEKGGIGFYDISLDAAVLKSVLGAMRAHETTLKLPGGGEDALKRAFDAGLASALDRMVDDKEALAQAVRATRPQPFLKVPKTIEDLVQLFGTDEGIRFALSDDVIDALAKEWDVADRDEVIRRMRHALDVYNGLVSVRDGNRTLAHEFARRRPDLAQAIVSRVHESWLAKARGEPGFVEYTPALHELLLEYADKGALRAVDAEGASVQVTRAMLEDPAGKLKIAPEGVDLTGEARAEFERRFEKATGRALEQKTEDGQTIKRVVNTVAAPWDALLSLRAGDEAWAAKRREFLVGLQEDNVGAVLSAVTGPQGAARLSTLESGTPNEKAAAFVDIFREADLGFRLNDKGYGFNYRLINRPFDLEENGGVGLDAIQATAAAVKPVFDVLAEHSGDKDLGLDRSVSRSLKRALAGDAPQVLESLLDKGRLEAAVRRNHLEEDFTPDLARLRSGKIFQPVKLDAELRAAGVSLEQEAFIRQHGGQILSVYDFLGKADSAELRGAYSLGSDDPAGLYQGLTARARLKPWKTAYLSLYESRSIARTTDFLKQITSKDQGKPIVFFVPRHPAGEYRFTQEELQWLLEHPDAIKRVRFVFGAYDFISKSDLAASGLAAQEPALRARTLAALLREPQSRLVTAAGLPEPPPQLAPRPTPARVAERLANALLDRLAGARGRDPRVLANGRLSQVARRRALFEQNLKEAQVDAVMAAHDEGNERGLKCPVYRCSDAQIKQKLRLMEQGGLPPELAKRMIREGFAGSYEDAAAAAPQAFPAEVQEALRRSLPQDERADASPWLEQVSSQLRASLEGFAEPATLGVEGDKLVLSLPASGRDYRIKLEGSDGRSRMTPYGDQYTEFIPRPFLSPDEAAREIVFQIDDLAKHARDVRNARAGLGFSQEPPAAGDLVYADLPGLRQRISKPRDTVTFYRGFRAVDLDAAEAFARQGLLSLQDTAALKAKLEAFLRLEPADRLSFLGSEAVTRRVGSASALVGGSAAFDAAAHWGNVVFEAAVPREAMYFQTRDGLYHGEAEDYVPFALHHSWIKRVLDKDGNVLLDLTGGEPARTGRELEYKLGMLSTTIYPKQGEILVESNPSKISRDALDKPLVEKLARDARYWGIEDRMAPLLDAGTPEGRALRESLERTLGAAYDAALRSQDKEPGLILEPRVRGDRLSISIRRGPDAIPTTFELPLAPAERALAAPRAPQDREALGAKSEKAYRRREQGMDLASLNRARLDRAIELADEKPLVLSDKEAAVERLGSQGDESSCAVYSVAACAAALGRDVDLAAAKTEAVKVRPEVGLKGLFHDQTRLLAERLGFNVRFLDTTRAAERAAVRALREGPKTDAAKAFERAAGVLRQNALRELEKGHGVLLAIDLAKAGHAISLLDVKDGVARYYDPAVGRVLELPYEDLLPSQVMVLEAPVARQLISTRGGQLRVDGEPYHDDELALYGPVTQGLLRELESRETAPVMDRVRRIFETTSGARLPFWYDQKLPIVLRELIQNARRATRAQAEAGKIAVEASVIDGKLRITVSNTGADMRGVDMEEWFSRDFTTKSDKRNTGIGLDQSRRFVEEIHGGTLVPSANPGGGVRMTIEIPLGPDARVAPRPQPAAQPRQGPPGRPLAAASRVSDEELLANAAFMDRAGGEERLQGIMRRLGVPRDQAELVARAHDEIPCEIGRCDESELASKLRIMRPPRPAWQQAILTRGGWLRADVGSRTGLDAETARRALELGLAGRTPKSGLDRAALERQAGQALQTLEASDAVGLPLELRSWDRLGAAGSATAGAAAQPRAIRSLPDFAMLDHRYQFAINYADPSLQNRRRHSEYTASVAREISQRLGLSAASQDLAATIALAHDIGHPPFSHWGEAAINKKLAPYDVGWDHDLNGLQAINLWSDRPNPALPAAVIEGIAKRYWRFDASKPPSAVNHSVDELPKAVTSRPDFAQLQLDRYNHLEGQIAAQADRIAFNSTDIADGLRVGRLKPEDLKDNFPSAYRAYREVLAETADTLRRSLDFPVTAEEVMERIEAAPDMADYVYRRFPERFRRLQVQDLMETTRANLEKAEREGRLQGPDDVRDQDHLLADFSAGLRSDFGRFMAFSRTDLFTRTAPFETLVDAALDEILSGRAALPPAYAERLSRAGSPAERILVAAEYMTRELSDRDVLRLAQERAPETFSRSFPGYESARSAPLTDAQMAERLGTSLAGLRHKVSERSGIPVVRLEDVDLSAAKTAPVVWSRVDYVVQVPEEGETIKIPRDGSYRSGERYSKGAPIVDTTRNPFTGKGVVFFNRRSDQWMAARSGRQGSQREVVVVRDVSPATVERLDAIRSRWRDRDNPNLAEFKDFLAASQDRALYPSTVVKAQGVIGRWEAGQTEASRVAYVPHAFEMDFGDGDTQKFYDGAFVVSSDRGGRAVLAPVDARLRLRNQDGSKLSPDREPIQRFDFVSPYQTAREVSAARATTVNLVGMGVSGISAATHLVDEFAARREKGRKLVLNFIDPSYEPGGPTYNRPSANNVAMANPIGILGLKDRGDFLKALDSDPDKWLALIPHLLEGYDPVHRRFDPNTLITHNEYGIYLKDHLLGLVSRIDSGGLPIEIHHIRNSVVSARGTTLTLKGGETVEGDATVFGIGNALPRKLSSMDDPNVLLDDQDGYYRLDDHAWAKGNVNESESTVVLGTGNGALFGALWAIGNGYEGTFLIAARP